MRRARAGTAPTSMTLSLPVTARRLPWVRWTGCACASRHQCRSPTTAWPA